MVVAVADAANVLVVVAVAVVAVAVDIAACVRRQRCAPVRFTSD